MNLTDKKCLPCEGGVPRFSPAEAATYLKQLPLDWSILEDIKIQKRFIFENFVQAIDFVNEVAKLAEAEGHHPDIIIYYNKVDIILWTHAISGLSENDFIVAAKIEQLPSLKNIKK